MAGFWSSLASFGLGDLENVDLFENKKKEEEKAKELPKEEDFLLDKMVLCPVCEKESQQKIMKTGKAKLLSADVDLRPVYEHLDAAKYDVYQCEFCGYAGLAKNYSKLSPKQIQLINEGICSKVVLKNSYSGTTYSYEQAIERYQLALASAVVKKAKASEKAYICLKTGWLMRGFAESVAAGEKEEEKYKQIKAAEMDYLTKAYQGFAKAVTEESFPMAGMDESTVDYLLAAVALKIGRTDIASRQVSKILQNTNVPSRVKDKARDLKDIIVEEIKKNKQEQ